MIYKEIIQIFILAAFSTVVLFFGCVKGKFDQAPLLQEFQLSPGDSLISITQLKSLHNPNSTQLDSISANYIIQGIIISNDSCGNVYKAITIQDTSGGITIGIDNSSMYLKYYLGQKIYVKCKGLFLGGQIFSLSGAHLTATQLGFKEGQAIGSIPDALKTNYFFRQGFPDTVPTPKVFTAFNQLYNGTQLIQKYIGTMITVQNVHFANAGAQFNPGNPAPIQDLMDSTNSIITFYASPYSCFSKDTVPAGKVDITGILSSYDGSYQLIARSKNDIKIYSK